MYDMNIEICSISDDDDVFELNKQIKVPSKNFHIDLAESSTATANKFIESNDALFQLQLQRPNKLSRSRAPVNQQKSKDNDIMLMETSLMVLDATPLHPAIHKPSSKSNAPAASSLILTPSFPSNSSAAVASTSGVQNSYSRQLTTTVNNQITLQPFLSFTTPQSSTSLMSTKAPKSQAIIQDGSTNVTFVQPAISAISSSSSTEPELVLSPAKLGQ